MTTLNISWEDYHKKTEQLAVKVHEDKWEFNQVVCIAKGTLNILAKTSPTLIPPLAMHTT